MLSGPCLIPRVPTRGLPQNIWLDLRYSSGHCGEDMSHRQRQLRLRTSVLKRMVKKPKPARVCVLPPAKLVTDPAELASSVEQSSQLWLHRKGTWSSRQSVDFTHTTSSAYFVQPTSFVCTSMERMRPDFLWARKSLSCLEPLRWDELFFHRQCVTCPKSEIQTTP